MLEKIQIIEQQIIDCLIGKTETVYMAWKYPALSNDKKRSDLLEVLNHEIIKYEDSDAVGPFLKAMFGEDPEYADGLNAYVRSIVHRWATESYESMSNKEREMRGVK